MRHSKTLVSIAALLASASLSRAQNIGLPPGTRQWIPLSGNWVGDGLCCDEAIGGIGSIPDPSPNYVGDTASLNAGGRVFANGDSTANRLRMSYSDFHVLTVFMANSMVDTYTISGPPGSAGTPVNARLIVRAVGTLFVGTTLTNGLHVGGTFAELEVGNWNADPNPSLPEQFRVLPFSDPDFVSRASIPFANYGGSTPTLAIDLVIDQTLSEVVGTSFDVAYGLNINGDGVGNLSESSSPAPNEYVVATIDWELPPGYAITSVLGWSDPTFASYCTAGTSASGCVATLSAAGTPSAAAPSGFVVSASAVEGDKDGMFFFGTSGRLATPWGTTSSFRCVAPPLFRGGSLPKVGTAGACDGAFGQDLNALWCPSCPKPTLNPGAGALVDLQLWYRDPLNAGNKTTSFSDALEFTLAP